MGLALRSCPVWSFWAGRFDHLVHLSTYLLMADGHVKVILPGYCVPGASSLSKFTISLFQKVLSQPSSDPHPHLPTKPVPVPHGGKRGLLAPWPSEPGLKLLTLFLQEALLLGSLAHRHCQWHDSAGGAHGEEKENGNSKVQTPPYLTGAPRDWAGFSITVMVVSVSFSGVSVSYSGIDGAGQRTERRQLSTGPHPTPPSPSTGHPGCRGGRYLGKDWMSHMASQAFSKEDPDFQPSCRFLQDTEKSGEGNNDVAGSLHGSKSSRPYRLINTGNIST